MHNLFDICRFIYAATAAGDAIMRCDFNGTNTQFLATGLEHIRRIVLDKEVATLYLRLFGIYISNNLRLYYSDLDNFRLVSDYA